MRKRNAGRRLLPLVLSLSLIGCATSSPPQQPAVVQPAQIPPPPPEIMVEPDLSQSYSEIVQRLLSIWRQKLTDWRRSL